MSLKGIFLGNTRWVNHACLDAERLREAAFDHPEHLHAGMSLQQIIQESVLNLAAWRNSIGGNQELDVYFTISLEEQHRPVVEGKSCQCDWNMLSSFEIKTLSLLLWGRCRICNICNIFIFCHVLIHPCVCHLLLISMKIIITPAKYCSPLSITRSDTSSIGAFVHYAVSWRCWWDRDLGQSRGRMPSKRWMLACWCTCF